MSLRFAHAHSISHLQVFSSLVALRRLTVNNCPRVGDNGMQVLRHLPQLTHLNLCGCIKVRRLGTPWQRPLQQPVARCSALPGIFCLSHSSLCLRQSCSGCISALTPGYALQQLPATTWQSCLLHRPVRAWLAVAAVSLTYKLSHRQMTGLCPGARDWPGSLPLWANTAAPPRPSFCNVCINVLCLPQVTNATLKVVTGLTKLESLTLGFTRVLNAGVAHLSRMTALTELHFFAEDVSDVALQVEWPAFSSCFQRL